MKKVLVFGTFDEINAGHIDFLTQAKRFGNELIVLVVDDESVSIYKGKPPVWSLERRMEAVRQLPLKPTVYEENIRQNWKSLMTIKPDVIVLSAKQAFWHQRVRLMLGDYNLTAKIVVLPEKQLETNATKAGQASAD